MNITLAPSQTGSYLFTLALSIYLLLRMEKKIDALAQAITTLVEHMARTKA